MEKEEFASGNVRKEVKDTPIPPHQDLSRLRFWHIGEKYFRESNYTLERGRLYHQNASDMATSLIPRVFCIYKD